MGIGGKRENGGGGSEGLVAYVAFVASATGGFRAAFDVVGGTGALYYVN